jgi:hypothetical protein
VATVLWLSGELPAGAVEYLATGTRLIIKDTSASKKLVYLSKDPSIGVPLPIGTDDPTIPLITTTFAINASNGNGSEIASFALPAAGWSMQQTSSGLRFRFSNRTLPAGSSPVRSALIRAGFLKLKAEDSGISLDEASQTAIGVRLDAGTSRWCSSFDANIAQNQPGLFKAKAQPAPPAMCASLFPPTTTTTTLPHVCGNGIIEGPEQCDGEEFCTATCSITATGCCEYGTSPGPVCAADLGALVTPHALFIGCTGLNGVFHLGSVPSGTTLCPDAPEVTWLSDGPCQPLGPVAPTTLCCNAPACFDAAVDDNADVSSFVRDCTYTVVQDPAPVVVGSCGPGGFCVPAH